MVNAFCFIEDVEALSKMVLCLHVSADFFLREVHKT